MLVTLEGMVVFIQPLINVLDDVSIIALQLSRESYTAFPESTIMEFKPEQRAKALLPMLVTLLGMKMEVSPWQLEKASFPMLVTPSGMVMAVRDVQLWKAFSPISFTS